MFYRHVAAGHKSSEPVPAGTGTAAPAVLSMLQMRVQSVTKQVVPELLKESGAAQLKSFEAQMVAAAAEQAGAFSFDLKAPRCPYTSLRAR